MIRARHAASRLRQHGMLNIGLALLFIALIGCTGVALDVAQLHRQQVLQHRPSQQNALRHMASFRTGGIASNHLQAKEPE